jgi:hypothetical protein
MKKNAFITGAIMLLFIVTANAQDTTSSPTSPTVDSISAKYQLKAMPAALTTEQVFPAIGEYESSSSTDAPHVKITLDESNKGIVWVEGLPQGKIKAMLRQSPATYKIPAQKAEDNKDISEGTLIYDRQTKTLMICIGKDYNDADPASAFATPAEPEPAQADLKNKTAKTKIKKEVKPKPWMYTGNKMESTTAMNMQ